MTYSLDVEYFIREVKQFPVIWDSNSDESKHRHKKLAAWDHLARKIVPDFDSMGAEVKAEVIKKFVNKWRNIRDSFVRMCKSAKTGKKKPYMYEKNLQFLYNVYKMDDDQNNCSDSDEVPLKENCKIEIEEIESIEPTWQLFGDDTFEKHRKRLKTGPTGEYVDVGTIGPPTCSYNTETTDDDRAFFESLLPVIKNFDIDQKLELRSKVLQLVTNIRKSAKKSKKDDDDFSD